MNAKNDFERMWVLRCRYLALAVALGPELMGDSFGVYGNCIDLCALPDKLIPITSL